MTSTPEIGNRVPNKISPFGSGINKNLLTPCRRVGLSRKIKTPNSIVKILSNDLNSSNNGNYDSSHIDTTPVNHRKSLSRRKHESLLRSHSSKSPMTISTADFESDKLNADIELLDCKENMSEKHLFERFSSEDLFDSNKDMPPANNIVTEMPSEILQNISTKKLKKKLSTHEPINTKDSVDENDHSLEAKTKISRKSKRRLSDDDFLSLKNKSSNESNKPKEISNFKKQIIIDDSDEDFRIISNCDSKQKQYKPEKTKDIKKTKRLKKTLSMKKSLSFTDDEFDNAVSKEVVNDDMKECKVQIQKLSEDDICCESNNTNINGKPLKKSVEIPNKPIDTINDDDDDDAFTFTPEQKKAEKNSLIQKIKVLERQVEQKQQKLANLKQASIYKSKHDVQSLKQLTSQWTNGCVLGLNDLLGQLQAHGPMNMATLINNMHIPSEMLTKLPINVEQL